MSVVTVASIVVASNIDGGSEVALMALHDDDWHLESPPPSVWAGIERAIRELAAADNGRTTPARLTLVPHWSEPPVRLETGRPERNG